MVSKACPKPFQQIPKQGHNEINHMILNLHVSVQSETKLTGESFSMRNLR